MTKAKRKERGREESEEQSDRERRVRVRVSDGKKESRRFKDRIDSEVDNGKKKFEERAKSDDDRAENDEVKVKKEDRDKERVDDRKRRERRRFGDKERVDDREERRERKKFDDRVKSDHDRAENEEVKLKEEDGDGKRSDNGRKRDRRRFEDREAKDEVVAEPTGRSGSQKNDGVVESLKVSSRLTSESTPANNHAVTKVSSISTTNENKGVNITGSHEVTGKSSTDGTTTTAGKIGNASLDALAKAKKALQMKKDIEEKLKKIPKLNKGTSSSYATSPSTAANMTAAGVTTSLSTFPGVSAASAKPLGVDPATHESVKRAWEIATKMGFRQDPEFAPMINLIPARLPPDASVVQKPAKPPVLRVDNQGRVIDEHGNIVNTSKPSNLSTLKVNINKQKKDAFQIHKPELDVDPEKNPHFDPRMGIDKNKILRPKRMTFQFVEEGKWSKDAEIIKLKNQFGEAQAKEMKAKQAQLAKAKAEPNINPNLIEVSERVITKEKQKEPIPEVEWWDVPLLRSGNYADFTDATTIEDKVKMEKLTIYVEHPRPIEPPAEPAPPPPQPLKLTKKEQKKLRTQRRLAREKERQEMIRQGLIEPPKPKVKMSNLMKVLGSEATQDPTKLEMEIRAAAAERERAHVDRNIARKLTPAERREKKERKLFDDPNNTLETIVSVYKINDLSHPKNRFKVDVNAQENRLTGCAVISEGFSVVVVEGGSKSIKRYGKLMLRRINWAEKLENEDEEEDEDDEKASNKCFLVWQGSVAKPSFNKFHVHECRTEAAARKVLFDAGVGHYWELAANFSEDQM